MATISVVTLESEIPFTRRYFWEAMGDDDVGEPISVINSPDGSVQVTGTHGGAEFTLEGSNDGINWFTLVDPFGNNVSLTDEGLVMFLPRVWMIRPMTAGGSGTDFDVILLLGA